MFSKEELIYLLRLSKSDVLNQDISTREGFNNYTDGMRVIEKLCKKIYKLFN